MLANQHQVQRGAEHARDLDPHGHSAARQGEHDDRGAQLQLRQALPERTSGGLAIRKRKAHGDTP
ncbi:hypothetical protein ASC76_06230 [Rhizobacter sp. Root404]|nr:hypothetical protein ASC76_06230 [Rhizobacter sp. Root404]